MDFFDRIDCAAGSFEGEGKTTRIVCWILEGYLEEVGDSLDQFSFETLLSRIAHLSASI